jgi:hypothetical protein
MDLHELHDLLEHQSGVVSRRQLVERGAGEGTMRRWLRRRELVVVHPGVYVDHTGPLTWSNRAWAGVLRYWPAALSHESVVQAAGELVHVAVDAARSPAGTPGIRVHRLQDLQGRVQWNLAPPRVRLEDSVLSLCSTAESRVAALTIASDACRRRRTTPERLLTELARRPRLQHRAWLQAVLEETAAGVQSPLESSYVRKVERAHGLPRGRRQLAQRTSTGAVYRDVVYEAQQVYVELDGRVGHELSRERWRDMDRDLEAATADRLTLRIGWIHAEDRPCQTADRLARVLRGRGWRGAPRRCGPGCRITVPIAVAR